MHPCLALSRTSEPALPNDDGGPLGNSRMSGQTVLQDGAQVARDWRQEKIQSPALLSDTLCRSPGARETLKKTSKSGEIRLSHELNG